MKKMLFIGIGSRIMMDDGIGVYLAEDLKPLFCDAVIKFIIGETDIDYSLSEISETDCVIIADAFLSGKNPGDITVLPLRSPERNKENMGFSLHGMHFFDMIQYSECKPSVVLIGIEPYEINYGLGLSDELQICYLEILKSVYNYINQCINLIDTNLTFDYNVNKHMLLTKPIT
jgi:hydrogenase maturation protease